MPDQLLMLVLFAFVSTFSPGPNNMLLLASGANIGLTRTIPHILGVALGFGLMLFLVGLGAKELFTLLPFLHQVLNWGCIAFLFYLALKIACSRAQLTAQDYRPMSFLSAVAFQWINPKGWSMALTAVSVYNPQASMLGLLVVTSTFILVNIPSCTSWVYAGEKISRLLQKPLHIRLFNFFMAALLIAATVPMLQSA